MRISVLNEATIREAQGLYGRAENYAEISNRLRRDGYRLLRRHHHARIWIKNRSVIMVYVSADKGIVDYLDFSKNSTNKHTPRISHHRVEVTDSLSMVGFDHLHDLNDARWKKIKPLTEFSQDNDDEDDFESVDDVYPSLIRLLKDLHRRGFFNRFNVDLDRGSWMEYETIPVLLVPFWTTRAGSFRE